MSASVDGVRRDAGESGTPVERWATTRRGRIIAGCLCALMVLWLGFKMGRVVLEGRTEVNDYECFLLGGRALLEGRDLYAARVDVEKKKGIFRGLPWVAMLMVPFVVAGHTVSAFLWPLVNLAALGASSYWCLKIARGIDAPVPWPIVVVPPLLVVRALDSNFGNGQINTLMLVLSSLGLYLYLRKKDVTAGLALGAAMMLKVMPGLLIAYFVWKREWRVVAGALGAALFLALVVPMPVYGVAGSGQSFRRWLDERVFPGAGTFHEGDGYVPGQSLRAISYRMLTASDASAHDKVVYRVNVASFSAGAAETVYKVGAAVLAVVLAIVCFGRGERGNAGRTALELSLVMTVMLLASPYSRKAHFLLLMLPMTFAYSRLALGGRCNRLCGQGPRAGGVRSRRDRVLLAAMIVCLLLTCLTSRGLVGKPVSRYLTALSCMGWGALALLVGLLATVGSLPRGRIKADHGRGAERDQTLA